MIADVISDVLEGCWEAVSTLPHDLASRVLIHSAILHSFPWLLNTYSMLGPVLDTGDTVMNIVDKTSALKNFSF